MHELIDINNTQIIAGKKWVSWQLVADDKKINEAKIFYEILVAVVFNYGYKELKIQGLIYGYLGEDESRVTLWLPGSKS